MTAHAIRSISVRIDRWIAVVVHTLVQVPVEDDLGWMLDGFLNVHFFGWISVSIGSICNHFGDSLTPTNETFGGIFKFWLS
jgi:hypothetical protein